MNIIITGCSQGIGYEIASIFTLAGNHKIIGISRNIEPLKDLEKKGDNKSFKGIAFDLTTIHKKGDILLNEIKKHMDCVDILINNAGFLVKKDFLLFSQDEIHQIFNTNIFAPAKLIELLLPQMGKKNRSHIVNIGSMAGFQGSSKFPGLSWYSSSKAALAILTESLSIELKEYNVSVNCLALGSVETTMLARAFPGLKAPVTSVEMAKYIAEFAVSGNKIFNGKIIPVALTNP
jgi:short-subunit dehydrogenase